MNLWQTPTGRSGLSLVALALFGWLLSPMPALAAGGSTVWQVEGHDERGDYTGRVQLIPAAGAGFRFLRVIDYADTVRVEDDRGLSWVWQGTAEPLAGGGYQVAASLRKADFVRQRGALIRRQAEQLPVPVTGQFLPAQGSLQGTYVLGQAGERVGPETWSLPEPGGDMPIFVGYLRETPTHVAVPGSVRDFLFDLFKSYRQLPAVLPYTDLPAFRNPVHIAVSDRTDFDYYQRHGDRLRVVDKIVDPISLQETLARADAFKWTLAGKAEHFDRVTAERAIDAATGLLFEFVDAEGKGYPSHDAALWTGAYAASQALRHRLTADPAARDNLVRSVEGLMTLLEITGNRRIFARTLRKAEGRPVPPWYPGQGTLAHLEWEAGGNNDMYKGVMLGMAMAQAAVCEDGREGHAAFCQRLHDNSVQVASQLQVAQASGYNRLAALWLAAYTTGDPLVIRAARKEWNRQAANLGAGSSTVYSYGIADWSGTHLAAVQYLLFNLLSERSPLPGIDSCSVLRRGVEAVYHDFSRVPLGPWSVLFARLGTLPHSDAAQAALWRLRELPAPKPRLAIDHRIRSDFVMSPFPSAPWKFDWEDNDRTQSQRMTPLFEASAYTVYAWKHSPLEYKASSVAVDYPGADFLFAYWLGRSLDLFTAAD